MGRNSSVMERVGDLRRDIVSGFGGISRRRQRTSTPRDSADVDKHMELLQPMRFRDRELLHMKDRDRDEELPKRRRIDRQQRTGGGGGNGENFRKIESSDSSDEEYYGDEEAALRIRQQDRVNQRIPSSSLLSNQRRNLRSLRSSPLLKSTDDEIIGVPVPRRARSSSGKRLHEYRSSGRGRFGDFSSVHRFSSSPASLKFNSSDSPSSSGSSMNKKMKSAEPVTRPINVRSHSRRIIQDDIELEVAEALFDLRKQSNSSNSVDRNDKNTVDDEKRSKTESGNCAFSVQKQQSMKVAAETIKVDSIEELQKDGRIGKEKAAQNSGTGGVFVNIGKVTSPRESKSPSRVAVNTCKFQDSTVTKVDQEALLAENRKDVKLDINLLTPLTLLPPPRKDALVDVASTAKVVTGNALERKETISKDGPSIVPCQPLEGNQLPNIDFVKHGEDICVTDGSKGNHGHMECKNQVSPTVQPFPMTMSGWPGIVHQPGYMASLQVAIPVDESARPLAAVQPPQFQFSEPRPKKCATHQYLAYNIQRHHQLVKESLSSVPAGATTLYGRKSLSPISAPVTQNFVSKKPDFQAGQYMRVVSAETGNAKSSEVADKRLPQQIHQAPANNHFHGQTFVFPFGHNQSMGIAASVASDTSRPAQSTPAVGDTSLPSNSSGGPSGESSSSYMAMLQKNGYQFPISSNSGMPPPKGGTQAPTFPMFTSSFYSSPMFNVSQNQQQKLSFPHSQSTSNGSSQSHKSVQNQKPASARSTQNKFPNSHQQLPTSHSLNNGQNSSFPVMPMNYAMIPPGMMCGIVGNNKHGDPQQKGSKDQGMVYSFGSTNPGHNFSSTPAIFSMHPENGYQMTKQKNFQESEEKSDNGQKGMLRKSESSGGGQTVDFPKSGYGGDISSGLTGKQNFPPMPAGLSALTLSNFQQYQQQFMQMQKHQMQQQMQMGQGKNNSLVNFPTYTQNGACEKKSSYNGPQWENLPTAELSSSSSPSQYAMSKIMQQQQKSNPGQMHISFGNISDQANQGPQYGSSSNFSTSKNTVRNCSSLGKNGTVISTQQADAACRGNVPSILTTCPGQLSELKY